MSVKNLNVYELLDAQAMRFVGTSLASSPQEAARRTARQPGKYVVTDLDFTEIERVDLRLEAV